jgi:hypothetical protein
VNSTVVGAPLVPAPDIAGLEPIQTIKSRWPAIIGGLLTVAMILGLAHELFGSGLEGLRRAVPQGWLYYIAFALLYMSPPTGDYVIFRRLWNIPPEGLAALIKKRIANEVLFGYSGEAYFYAWARQRARMVAAPFGAVKDVSILSALAGNAMTIAMIVLALPFAYHLLDPNQIKGVFVSMGIVFAMCLPFLIFSRRVFSLERGELWWVFMVHCLRLIAGCLLIAFAWHWALPGVAIGTWLLLSAARMLVSRLPFVPNKDLLFANFAILLIGENNALSELVAFTSALTLLVHVALIGVFSAHAVLLRKKA